MKKFAFPSFLFALAAFGGLYVLFLHLMSFIQLDNLKETHTSNDNKSKVVYPVIREGTNLEELSEYLKAYFGIWENHKVLKNFSVDHAENPSNGEILIFSFCLNISNEDLSKGSLENIIRQYLIEKAFLSNLKFTLSKLLENEYSFGPIYDYKFTWQDDNMVCGGATLLSDGLIE